MFSGANLAVGAAIAFGLVVAPVLGIAAVDPAGAAAGHFGADASRGGVRPVPGAVVRAFEAPAHRYGSGHRGVDLAARPGAPVRAARGGVVTWAGEVAGIGYVTVDHGGGLSTTYGNVEPVVTPATRIAAGQRIGVLAADAAHLDWGARWEGGPRRTYIDPLKLLWDLRPVLVRPVAGV